MSDLDDARARFERLSTADEVLFDMSEAAWVSMERNDFAHTAGERAKLDYLKGVRDAVKNETSEARRSWRAALTAEIARNAEQRRTRTSSRRIERSR
ncbi:hypothetical protein IU501_18505 [Nocardia otitidiscaviarum]|uniref:hypothetical protein n=1 Tax=Nocardia otitidiscaviarum TaxID=1823 RepID=UPI0018951064|nr:hypothetical protein [Nocardia otitidiscaviarum]MBF6134988.1 hypothetical protein [Nocardia otitidiscaviarum]